MGAGAQKPGMHRKKPDLQAVGRTKLRNCQGKAWEGLEAFHVKGHKCKLLGVGRGWPEKWWARYISGDG